jgi:hypothetical protein
MNGGSENGEKMAKIAAMAYQRGGMAWRRGSQREMAAIRRKIWRRKWRGGASKISISENNNESDGASWASAAWRISWRRNMYQRRAAWRRRNNSVSVASAWHVQRNGISGVAAIALRMA